MTGSIRSGGWARQSCSSGRAARTSGVRSGFRAPTPYLRGATPYRIAARRPSSTFGCMRKALLGVLLVVASLAPAGVLAGSASADVVWLCHPGTTPDPCETPLDTTVIAADGSTSVQTPVRPPAADRPVDCFYVYPTVSNQLGPNATKAKDPEILAIPKFQASRFSPGCRMFAPVYRQATVPAVAGNFAPPIAEKAYADVVEAWRQYLAKDNGGRGVILIGHSQGTIMLRHLIAQEIDPDPAARARLVGAFILGGNVTTKAGQPTGGDFQHVPICTQGGEDGCVVAYSTYSTDPGVFSTFGNTNTDALHFAFGTPAGAGYEVACTDPGPLSGLSGPASLVIPTTPFPPGPIAVGIIATSNGPIPTAPTTWVEGFAYTGACRTINGAHIYRYEPVGSGRRLNESPPTWGTHLVDMNLGVERLTTIAARQTHTWLADHLAAGTPVVSRRAGTATLPVIVPGPGRVTLTAGGRLLRTRAAVASAPATLRLRVVPSARGRRVLRRHGRLTVAARVVYRPAIGAAITTTSTVRLTLRR